MEILIAAFREDTAPKILICERTVSRYYRELLDPNIKTITFEWSRLLVISGALLKTKLMKRKGLQRVNLITLHYSGLGILYASTLVDINKIIYVNDSPAIGGVVRGWTWKIRIHERVLSLISDFKVVSYRLEDGQIAGLRKDERFHFLPPHNSAFTRPQIQHDYDLIILDFQLAGIPLDLERTFERIKDVLRLYRKPAIKPHPTFRGVMEGIEGLPVLDPGIPAENFALPGVHCMSLLSTAETAFSRVIDVHDLLVLKSGPHQAAWTKRGSLVYKCNRWHLKKDT